MTSPALLVTGHTLVNEGKPLNMLNCPECKKDQPARLGHARCSCGEVSPHLDSDAKRKVWHRDHKRDIQAVRSGDLHVCGPKTPRAEEIWRLTQSLGRRKNPPQDRAEFDALTEHLMLVNVQNLCPLCGHSLTYQIRAAAG